MAEQWYDGDAARADARVLPPRALRLSRRPARPGSQRSAVQFALRPIPRLALAGSPTPISACTASASISARRTISRATRNWCCGSSNSSRGTASARRRRPSSGSKLGCRGCACISRSRAASGRHSTRSPLSAACPAGRARHARNRRAHRASSRNWKPIECLVIRDFYHRYTVDEHTLVAMQNSGPAQRKEASRSSAICWRRWNNPACLIFALLFHDAGKGAPERQGHVDASVEPGRRPPWRASTCPRAIAKLCSS